MALSNIAGWNKEDEKQAGTACGASDKQELMQEEGDGQDELFFFSMAHYG